jgi:CheY-like chemotaxis protein
MATEGRKPNPSLTQTMLDVNEVLRNVVHSHECRQSGAGIHFIVDCADALPSVSAGRDEIEHVLSVLVTNAEDAIGTNPDRPGQIHLKTAVLGSCIQVTVTDNGRGIHWREMASLFGDESDDSHLTACAEIVKDAGGDLYAWSRYGNGSIFTLDLPIHVEASEQDVSGLKGLQGKRILVIDDEAQISTLMCDMLKQQGAKIDLANSGRQAFEQIKATQYDLCICDQRMADLSGEGLYRSLESTNPELRSRFLFVTGDVLNDETDDFFTQSGVHHIRKPFRSVELVAAAEQVLSQSQQLDF